MPHCWYRLIVLLLFPLAVFANPNKIVFWHSMSGQLGLEVKQLAEAFNQSQTQFKVEPLYKGDYMESLTGFAAAFRAGQVPNLIQVFEVGSSVMRFPKGIIKPVETVFKEQGISVRDLHLFPVIANNYSDADQLIAFPFNVSVPVLFYNADLVARFGITKKTFPMTWDGLEALVQRIHDAGYDCSYTTAYPAWVLIESYAAIHGLSGKALDAELPHHLNRLKRWQKAHYFEYGGHVDDATVLFTSERCPLFSQSSGAYASLSQMVPFTLGVAPLPLDTSISQQRHNNVVGGAAIWIVAGQSPEMEHGIALFLKFLAQKNIQKKWFEHTGYLPLQKIQRTLTKGETPHTILDIANLDFSNIENTQSSLRKEAQSQVRKIYDQMLESIFSGILSTESALAESKNRIHYAQKRFRLNTEETEK